MREMQALKLQAELTGTAMPTLQRGVQRFNRTLGEALDGTGEGAKAFEEFKLNAEISKLHWTGSSALLLTRSTRTKRPPMGQAAYRLFGRQGQDLLTFFAGGSKGINDATRRNRRLTGEITRKSWPGSEH